MRFKIDKNFLKVANEIKAFPTEIPAEQAAKEMCERFIKLGIIEDTPDNYGLTFIQATGDAPVSDVCDSICTYLYGEIKPINNELFYALCRLTIMGDGACPHCGGELRFIETEGHELNDGDYYTPNSYIIDNYVYRCRECGETIKSEKEL